MSASSEEEILSDAAAAAAEIEEKSEVLVDAAAALSLYEHYDTTGAYFRHKPLVFLNDVDGTIHFWYCASGRVASGGVVLCCLCFGFSSLLSSTSLRARAHVLCRFASLLAVLVFDWDDTLLCSSWLAQNGLRLDFPEVIPAATMRQLEGLASSVVALLRRALTFGKVMIITNAETGWVELSAKRFMPEVLPLLPELDVFSARSNFESLSPDSPSDWKVCSPASSLYG
jgi:hypothetical protein